MSSKSASEYMQGRDHISTTKLNYFHFVLQDLLGWTLHPKIQVSSDEAIRVADLGSQTCIWPIAVAEDSQRRAEVDAFDLSERFFPPQAWLPANVRLHRHDITQPFPAEMLGQFDVVNLRLFLTLSEQQVQVFVRNAITLLKPNGYIQWVEHDKTMLHTTSATPGMPTPASTAFIELQQHPFPSYNPAWVASIAPTMEAAGLQVRTDDQITVRPSLLPQLSDLHLLSLMDVPVGLSPAIDTFREKHLDDMVNEFQRGIATVDGFRCVVGQRAG